MRILRLSLLFATADAFLSPPQQVRVNSAVLNRRSSFRSPFPENKIYSHVNLGVIDTPSPSCRRLSALREASSSSSNEEKNSDKALKRQKRVVLGYKLTSFVYLVPTLLGFVKKIKGENHMVWPLTLYASVGPILACGFAYILTDAAANNRLTSDTYKRLNFFLGEYGGFGLMLAVISPTMRHPVVLLPSVLGFINALKGWSYGVRGGFDKPHGAYLKELLNSVKTSLTTLLKIPKNIKSAGYLAATLLLFSLKLFKIVDLKNILMQGAVETTATATAAAAATSGVSMEVVSRIIRLSKLALMIAVSFTLKDAADRGRLEGTTFIELNFMSAFSFATMAVYMYSIVQGTPLAIAASFLSLFSLFNGVSSVRKKKAKKA